MSDLSRGLRELDDSAETYAERDAYRRNASPDFFVSREVARLVSRKASRFRLNFIGIPVRERLDRLEVAGVSTGTPADAELEQRFHEVNDLETLLEECFDGAAWLGDYYLTVWEGELDGGAEGIVRTVDAFANSPLNMRMVYSRSNTRVALFAIKRWESDEDDEQTGKPRVRANLYYADRIEQYITKRGQKGASARDFEPFVADDDDETEEDAHIIAHEYGVVPVFHFRQGSRPYGKPVNADAYGTQDAVNKLANTHLATVDFHAVPAYFALLRDGEDGDDAEFENDFDPTGKTEPTTEDGPGSKTKFGPGIVNYLEGVESLEQFAAAGSEPFLEPMRFYLAAMARLTSTPADAFSLSGTGEVPSGESRRRAEVPFTKSIRGMQRSYAHPISGAYELAAAMLGYEGLSAAVEWAPIDASTTAEDWEALGAMLKNGVPLREVLLKAGVPEKKILEWYPEGTPALSLSQLVELGSAVSALGQGVTLGAVPAPTMLELIAPYIAGERVEVGAPVLSPTADEDADAGIEE